MKTFNHRFSTLSKPTGMVLATAQLGVIGFVDFLTGHDLTLSAFYLLPIYWGTQAAGRRSGFLLAFVAATIYVVADAHSDYHYPHAWMLYWNGLTLLVIFLVFVFWLTRFHAANRLLDEALQIQTAAVQGLQAEIKERKLLETAKLEAERFAALGKMAAQVAHEIRNPLTAINIRLHSLKKNLPPNGSEAEDARLIAYEIQRLDSVVDEFLMFARPASPKLFTISADSLFARMQSLFGPQFAKTSFRLTFESVPDTWVRVDPHQMEQVLINLIQNASESMPRGGTITLRARSGTASPGSGTGPILILEVEDTGRGIPPEVRDRIFEPFFTTREEGTGLGLAIAARIIEQHGGTLECRSEVNRGTTFVIQLPLAKPETSNESPDAHIID